MPPAPTKLGVLGVNGFSGPRGDVAEVGATDLCERVVAEHRVDRFGKLGAALLVDATGVIPDPSEAEAFGDGAADADFWGRTIP